MPGPLLRYQLTPSGISPRWIPGSCDDSGEFLPNFFANGDEHNELGSVDESSANAILMNDKRMAKQSTILENLTEPLIFGPNIADISFVGFGSSRNVILDLLNFLESRDLTANNLEKNQNIEIKNLENFNNSKFQQKTEINQKTKNLYSMLNFQNNLWSKLSNFKLKVNYFHFSYLWPLKTTKFQDFIKHNSSSKICLIEGNSTGQLGTLLKSQIGYEFPHKLLKYDGRQFFIEDLLEFIQKISQEN